MNVDGHRPRRNEWTDTRIAIDLGRKEAESKQKPTYTRDFYNGNQVQGKIFVVSTVSCNKSPYAIPIEA
jgi:hypothetical protein